MTAETWPLVGDPAEEIADPDSDTEEQPGTDLVPVEEAELVLIDEPGDLVPAQEPSALPLLTVRNLHEVEPVLPGWLRDRQTFLATAEWAARRGVHLTAFHSLRAPLYAARLAFLLAPVGFGRSVRLWARWVSDSDGRAVRANLASGPAVSPEAFYRVTEQRDHKVRGRLAVSGLAAVLLLVGIFLAITLATALGFALGVVLVILILAIMGRTPGKSILMHSTSTDAPPRLSETLILTALRSLGIGELNSAVRAADKIGSNATAVHFPAPIREDGPGWRADIDLPPGVTADQVIERRDRLASGLRRPLGAVWPQPDGDAHTGRLVLWVGHKPMNKAKPVAWTLAKRGTVDLFAPFPIGVDPRGRPVYITLMFALMVIGAQPRMGKSFLLRLLVLAASLDPRSEIHLYDLKGGADFIPLEPVAHRLVIGDDADDIAALLADVRELAEHDMPRRYKTVRRLPRDICPEGKITPELASRRDLGLHPIVLALDECQRAFEHPEHGKALEAYITDLAKRGPAVGIIVILATQRPDAKSLPTGISSNAILRFCLRVGDQTANDMVMGTSAYKAGIRATMFARSEVGVGYLAGEADEPTITRTAYVDALTAEAIAVRARSARIAAGLLTGQAAGGDTLHDVKPSTLEHVLQVWPGEESRAAYAALAERLREAFPQQYSWWGVEQVSAALRAYKVPSVQVKRVVDGKQVNRQGIAREALLEALGQVQAQAELDRQRGQAAAAGEVSL